MALIWIIVIIVFILAGLSLIIWLYLKNKKPAPTPNAPGKFNQTCNEKATPDCATGLTCSGGTTIAVGVCKQSVGSGCTGDSDCVAGAICGVDKICGTSTTGGLNQPCGATGGCNSGLSCLGGFCKLQSGQKCFNGSDCVSGNCPNGFCAPGQAGALGSVCLGSTGCSSGLTCSAGFCQPPQYPTGTPYSFCRAGGSTCGTNSRCRNNVCLPITGGFGNACEANISCSSTLVCDPTGGICRFNSTNPNICGTDGVCVVGSCFSGLCRSSSGGACTGGAVCFSGSCKPPIVENDTLLGTITVVGGPSGVVFLETGASTDPFIRYFNRPNLSTVGMTKSAIYRQASDNIFYPFINPNGYAPLDFSSNGTGIIGIFRVQVGNVFMGNGVYQVVNGNFAPLTTNPLVMVGSIQYDPFEISVSSAGDIVVSAGLHSNSNLPPILLSYSGGVWSLISIPTTIPAGPRTKPRYYGTGSDFGFITGNTIYLAGTLIGLTYAVPASINDYDLNGTGTAPIISVLVNVGSGILYYGTFGYGSPLVAPFQGWIPATGRVQLYTPTQPGWYSPTSCS